MGKKHNRKSKNNRASQTLNGLRQTSDTLISDSRIRMCYLARHDIDVDAALARLGDNVEKYNELALAFLRESGRCEDALYDLMSPETLAQYGSHARSLRIRANELGLVKLTDTAFFHEIEACAGFFGVVRANWEKLVCDLDEAYAILDKYAKSLGLRGDAVDKEGNHI